MISSNDERVFLLDVIPSNLLSYAVDWIESNLEPDDVFNENTLREWALNNGFTEEED